MAGTERIGDGIDDGIDDGIEDRIDDGIADPTGGGVSDDELGSDQGQPDERAAGGGGRSSGGRALLGLARGRPFLRRFLLAEVLGPPHAHTGPHRHRSPMQARNADSKGLPSPSNTASED